MSTAAVLSRGACSPWSPSFLSALHSPSLADAVVRVSCASGALFSGREATQHVAMRLGTFLQHAAQLGTSADPLREVAGGDSPAPAMSFYLAQCALHRSAGDCAVQLPQLAPWACAPPHPTRGALAPSSAHLWASAGPCISAAHYDDEDNVLCVLAGRKEVAVAPPSCAAVRAYPLHSALRHHAQPGGAELLGHAAAVTHTLHAGDALFIPAGHWHAVRSDARTIAVNFWWATEERLGVDEGQGEAADEQRARSSLLALCSAEAARSRERLAMDARAWALAAGGGLSLRGGLSLADALSAPEGGGGGGREVAAVLCALQPAALAPEQRGARAQEAVGPHCALLPPHCGCERPAAGASRLPLHLAGAPSSPPPAACPLCPSHAGALAEALLLACTPRRGLEALWGCPPATAAWLLCAALSPIGLDALSHRWEEAAAGGGGRVAGRTGAAEGGGQATWADTEERFERLWEGCNSSSEGVLGGRRFPDAIADARERVAAGVMERVLTRLVGVQVGCL